MDEYWRLSRHHLRIALKVSCVLAAVLMLNGCGPGLSPEGLAAATPQAQVWVNPALYCPGEILSLAWNGGGQIPGCADGDDPSGCKAGTMESNYDFLAFERGFDDRNLEGAAQGNSPRGVVYDFRYLVDWVGWSGYRSYRTEADFDDGPVITGVVQDRATAAPLLGPWTTFPAYRSECDETGNLIFTPLFTISRRGEELPPEEGVLLGRGWYPSYLPGSVSACTGSAQICIDENSRADVVTLSVPGGPTVTLGGTDGLSCTDAFAGYNYRDVVVTLTGTPDCTPGERGTGHSYFVNIQLAGSSMCATGPGPDGVFGNEDDIEQFGEVELEGVSRDRCTNSIDPGWLARFGPREPISGEIDLGEQCDLSVSCGDGTCSLLCEDAETCAVDCGPGVCGDQRLSPDEECETSDDCQGGLVCGAPDTDDACACVPATIDLPPVTQPDVVSAGETCEDFPIYDCVKTEFGYTWYTGRRCYDAEGNVTFDGQIDGPFSSAEWQPFCPGAGGGGGDEGGGGGGGYCGDGICQGSESGCGVCSADCGPC